VPGQDELAERREMIVRAADVVLFVVDSEAAALGASIERFHELLALLEQRKRQIPVLLQLNKRDSESALPKADLLERLDPELAHVETIATEAEGIREAFVLAVGASLRMLRNTAGLYNTGNLDTQEMQLPSPEQLLELLELF